MTAEDKDSSHSVSGAAAWFKLWRPLIGCHLSVLSPDWPISRTPCVSWPDPALSSYRYSVSLWRPSLLWPRQGCFWFDAHGTVDMSHSCWRQNFKRVKCLCGDRMNWNILNFDQSTWFDYQIDVCPRWPSCCFTACGWPGWFITRWRRMLTYIRHLANLSLPDIIGNKMLWRLVASLLQPGRGRGRLKYEGNMEPVNIYGYQHNRSKPLISHVPRRKSRISQLVIIMPGLQANNWIESCEGWSWVERRRQKWAK